MSKVFFSLFLVTVFTFSALVISALTPSDVERFMDVMEELIPYLEEIEDFDELEQNFLNSDDFNFDDEPLSLSSLRLEMIKSVEKINHLDSIIKKYGYSNVEEWADNGSRIILAFFTIGFDHYFSEAYDELSQILAELEQDPDISQEDVDMVRKMTLGIYDEFNRAPESDIKVVKPYIERLTELLGFDDEDLDY